MHMRINEVELIVESIVDSNPITENDAELIAEAIIADKWKEFEADDFIKILEGMINEGNDLPTF